MTLWHVYQAGVAVLLVGCAICTRRSPQTDIAWGTGLALLWPVWIPALAIALAFGMFGEHRHRPPMHRPAPDHDELEQRERDLPR